MTLTFFHILTIAAIVAAIFILLIALLFKLRQQVLSLINDSVQLKRQQTKTQLDTDSLFSRIDELEANIRVLRQSIQPLPDKIANVEGKLREHQAEDPQVKLYKKAASMAASGASAEEIALGCDLPMAEANVLVSLNR